MLLHDGRVLVAGGFTSGEAILESAEVYDPTSGRFHLTAPMAPHRYKLSAVPMPDGKALIVGGSDEYPAGNRQDTTEVFDPVSERFSHGPVMKQKRYKIHSSVVMLADGSALVAGGSQQAELYDSPTRSFRLIDSPMLDGFLFSTATVLKNGKVLIVGGYGSRPTDGAVRSGWLYSN